MRNVTLTLIGALILTLGESGMAVGQYTYRPNYQAYNQPYYQAYSQPNYQAGLFGYRALGLPLSPPPLAFNGGAPSSVTGRFQTVGQNAWNDFSPWRQPFQNVIEQTFVPSPAGQWTFAAPPSGEGTQYMSTPGTPTPVVQMGVPTQLQPPVPPPGYNTPAPLPEQGIGPAPGAEMGRAWNYTAGRSFSRAVSARVEPYVRSPELSARLTRIARARGMLAGRAIDVYLSDKVARVQGIVRNPADRAVLCNVLGLEPGVSQIDNRLVVQAYGHRRSNATAGSVRRSVPGYQANTTPAYGP